MSLTRHDDKKGNALSLMNQQKTLCNGQKKGFECRHYMRLLQKLDTDNAIALNRGETSRWCLLFETKDGPLDFADQGKDMAVECNHYKRSWLRPYNAEAESDQYNPLSEETVAELVQLGGYSPDQDPFADLAYVERNDQPQTPVCLPPTPSEEDEQSEDPAEDAGEKES